MHGELGGVNKHIQAVPNEVVGELGGVNNHIQAVPNEVVDSAKISCNKTHVSAQSVVPVLLRMRSILFLYTLCKTRFVLKLGSAAYSKSPEI
jgi:hypothetical protein